MGFFSQLKKSLKKQKASGDMSNMPSGGGGFLGKIKNKAFDRIESGEIPARSGFLRGQYFGPPQEEPMFSDMRYRGPRGNMGSDFRMPQMPKKRGGISGLSGLSGLFRKLQEQIKNQQIPLQMPQQMPQQNLNFLSRLDQNMMPKLDFSNLPQMAGNPNIPAPNGYELREDDKGMNYFKEQLSPEYQAQNMLPRRLDVPFQDFNLKNMRPGYAVGGPLMGRAANLSRQVLNKNRMGRDLPGRATSNMGDMVMSGRAASPLTDSLRRGTENLIMGGTGLGVATLADGTQTFREPFSKDNLGFMSPEAFGRDLAQLRMDAGAVINLAKNKASEMGEDINDYVSRAKSAYDQQMNQDMENQRMQELDAQQGMQPFSALLGPDMPLRRPEPTEGRTTSDIDDILSSLEKKN